MCRRGVAGRRPAPGPRGPGQVLDVPRELAARTPRRGYGLDRNGDRFTRAPEFGRRPMRIGPEIAPVRRLAGDEPSEFTFGFDVG